MFKKQIENLLVEVIAPALLIGICCVAIFGPLTILIMDKGEGLQMRKSCENIVTKVSGIEKDSAFYENYYGMCRDRFSKNYEELDSSEKKDLYLAYLRCLENISAAEEIEVCQSLLYLRLDELKDPQ
jgi:hypothetical protein